jgi:succinate dehydrogenase / fumarate reductase flavoprotein subunit
MTEHAGVVRDENGLTAGLREVAEIDERTGNIAVHPDIAGYHDLAHAFDLRSMILAARATLEAALERRETRGCYNRSDYPDIDQSQQANLVWSGPGELTREPIPAVPPSIAALIRDVSTDGELVE